MYLDILLIEQRTAGKSSFWPTSTDDPMHDV